MANLYIVDESIAGRERMELMMFGKFAAHLPGAREPGDIICLQGVRVRNKNLPILLLFVRRCSQITIIVAMKKV